MYRCLVVLVLTLIINKAQFQRRVIAKAFPIFCIGISPTKIKNVIYRHSRLGILNALKQPNVVGNSATDVVEDC